MKIEVGNLTEQDKKDRKAYPIKYTLNEFKNMKIAINAEQPLDELLEEVREVEIKLAKCELNSIMGVHWSSKLAGLKRKLGEMK